MLFLYCLKSDLNVRNYFILKNSFFFVINSLFVLSQLFLTFSRRQVFEFGFIGIIKPAQEEAFIGVS